MSGWSQCTMGQWVLGLLLTIWMPGRGIAVDSNNLRVVGTYPLPGQAVDRQIVLYFNQPIDVSGSDAPIPTFSFDRDVEGEYRYGDDFIAFEITSHMRDRAVLQLTLPEDLRALSGDRIDSGSRTFTFCWYELALRAADTVESGDRRRVLMLRFTEPVDLSDLQQKLTITNRQGQPVEFELHDRYRDVEVRFLQSQELPLDVKIAAGLKDREQNQQLAKDLWFCWPSERILYLEKAELSEVLPTYQQIRLHFKGAPSLEELEGTIRILDAETAEDISFELHREGGGRYLAKTSQILEGPADFLILARHGVLEDDGLRELGEDIWFNLGDRDLAVSVVALAFAPRRDPRASGQGHSSRHSAISSARSA